LKVLSIEIVDFIVYPLFFSNEVENPELLYAMIVAPIEDNVLWLITFPFTSPVSSGSDEIDVLAAC
jgi:hypothetical protein